MLLVEWSALRDRPVPAVASTTMSHECRRGLIDVTSGHDKVYVDIAQCEREQDDAASAPHSREGTTRGNRSST